MENDAAPGKSQPIERRLATIMMADVAGYSRMMGENEEGTVAVLRGHREIFDAMLKAHRGRVFNTAGDAILAEFPSAVEAVRCATEIQTALRTRNEHLPAEQRMWFRIGINLGDVIVQGEDLLGDGVNVAARIQTVAEPGGVCISGSVYDQIQNKLTLQIKQLGEKSFKNIAQPIRTFSITDDGVPPVPGARWRSLRKTPMVGTAVALIALIAAAGAASWYYRDYTQRGADEARRAAEAQRSADAQRKAEQEQAAAAAAQKEAKLLAELQAAKDALTQAEATKRKAELDRAAAEAAQREARLQTELRSARDAQQRAEASEKKADEERKAAAEALRAATAARTAAAKVAEPRGEAKLASAGAAASAAGAAAKGIERFDGPYLGRMCMQLPSESAPRCWQAALQVQNGSLSSTWRSRNSDNPARAEGTIAPDGTVTLSMKGYSTKGTELAGNMRGNWTDNAISATGAWANGVPVTGNWMRTR